MIAVWYSPSANKIVIRKVTNKIQIDEGEGFYSALTMTEHDYIYIGRYN